MDPKVSIIIGIYNVEKFLEKELSCVLNQTFQNIEIILVNDGSTDSSGKLCDQLALKDKRIKVIHKKNGGLGSARNTGLDIASGKYISFYDVDDEIEADLIEYCVKQAEEYEVEVIMFGMLIHNEYNNTIERLDFPDLNITGKKEIKYNFADKLFLKKWGNGFACNKFYLKDFLDKNDLRFEDQRIMQDEIFNIKMYYCVNRILLSSSLPYHWFIYKSGNSGNKFIQNKFDILKGVISRYNDLFQFWQLSDEKLFNHLRYRYIMYLINTSSTNLFHRQSNLSFMEREKIIKTIIKETRNTGYLEMKEILTQKGFYSKILLLGIKLNLPYYVLFMNYIKYTLKNIIRPNC